MKIARVAGYASSVLFDREDPYSPSNRRIDILVLTKRALQAIEGEPVEPAADDDTSVSPTTSKPVREKLNIFEEGVLQLDDVGN